MKTKTYPYVGILLFLILGISQSATAQLVTKYSGIEPQYSTGNPYSHLIWMEQYTPLAYSDHMVTRFSSNGSSIIYNKSYELNGHRENTYFDVQQIAGNTIFSTYNHLFATDVSGNPVWAKKPNHHLYNATVQSFCESNGGDILVFSAEEKYGETYLTIADLSSGSGALNSYTEFRLFIPTDIHQSSNVTTATRVPGEGYFLTLSTSADEAYTISLDFGLNIIAFNKQEFVFNGSNEPLDIHEVLLTDDAEMFFIEGLNDGSTSTPSGAIIGKLNFGHEVSTLKYVEPSNTSHYFGPIIGERSLIVETEESIRVNLEVEGDGTIATLVDAVTYAFAYYNGNKYLSALVQYDSDFTLLAQTVAYDYGNSNEYARNNNIIKDYRDQIHMKVGVFENPSHTPGVIDTSYYNIVPEDDFYNNCHSVGFEMSETDLEAIRNEADFSFSTDEFELLEVDIVDTDLEFGIHEDCEESRHPIIAPGNILIEGNKGAASIYPNPSNGNVFVELLEMENATIAVYATTGELVRTEQKAVNNRVEITNLPKGVYIIAITDQTGITQNERVIVK